MQCCNFNIKFYERCYHTHVTSVVRASTQNTSTIKTDLFSPLSMTSFIVKSTYRSSLLFFFCVISTCRSVRTTRRHQKTRMRHRRNDSESLASNRRTCAVVQPTPRMLRWRRTASKRRHYLVIKRVSNPAVSWQYRPIVVNYASNFCVAITCQTIYTWLRSSFENESRWSSTGSRAHACAQHALPRKRWRQCEWHGRQPQRTTVRRRGAERRERRRRASQVCLLFSHPPSPDVVLDNIKSRSRMSVASINYTGTRFF